MSKIAFLFPGQGAQYPGMGRDFYEEFFVAKEVFHQADDFLNTHFSQLIFEGAAEQLILTKNSQLAIYITSTAIFRVVQHLYPEICPAFCAGLSLGEYTALMVAQKIGFLEGLDLVRCRAEAMQLACENHPGGMEVVLGLSEEVIETTLHQLGPERSVWIANLNCPGQVVIAGTLEGIARARSALKEQGAKRILPLDVSGAFHSGLMLSAKEALSKKIDKIDWQQSDIPVAMNKVGDFVLEKAEMQQALLEQVISPVRWEQTIRAMERSHVTHYVEMGPGKTLGGMNKRIDVQGSTLSIEKVEDLGILSQFKEIQCIL